MAITLPWKKTARDVPDFFEMRTGIVGANGGRFQTTEALLREYAGPVLDQVGLGALIRQSEVWLESARAVGVLALALSLTWLPWWGGLLLSALAFVAWGSLAPALATPRLVGPLRAIAAPIVQAGAFVLALSGVASQGEFTSVWVGLAGFVLYRLGAVNVIASPAIAWIGSRFYPLGLADQTLRSIILRWALIRGVKLPEIAMMEKRAKALLAGSKKRK